MSTADVALASSFVGHGSPIHVQVYDRLWEGLMAGELPAGQRLKDTEWSVRLGVSRTPVREAFRKLAHDGALDALETVGYKVHAFSPSEVAGLYRCRAALEALVAEEVASEPNPDLLVRLAANIEAAERELEADDFVALQRLNGEFHFILVNASRDPHLRRLLEQTGRIVRMARRQVMMHAGSDDALRSDYRDSLQLVVADHRALLAALAAGDAARSATLMRNHLLATAQRMSALLQGCGTAEQPASPPSNRRAAGAK
jgi:DNA-binding GntR family transcriptional regulator